MLMLEENADEAAHLSQYFVRYVESPRRGTQSTKRLRSCTETDKFRLIYVILKLKLG